MKKLFVILIFVMALSFSALGQGSAESTDIIERLERLEKRQLELEELLKEKDARIAELEAKAKKIDELESKTDRIDELETQAAASEKELGTVIEKMFPTASEEDFMTSHYWEPREKIGNVDEPRYFRIPQTNTYLDIGGYIMFDAIYDTKKMGNKTGFSPSTIPTDFDGTEGETTFSAGQTRLHIKSITPTEYGDLRTLVEFDFYNTDNSADFHSLRYWGELAGWGAGRQFTAFMDISVFPNILDYWGPNGMIFVRQAQARYTHSFDKGLDWALALEDPDSDVTAPIGETGSGAETLPDFTTHLRWEDDFGHVQLAGLLRKITFEADTGSDDSTMGWGVNLSSAINTVGKDRIVFQSVYGEGIGRYMNDTCCGCGGLDAAFDGAGDLDAVPSYGGFLYYDHWWDEQFSSSIGYGYAWVDNNAGQDDSAFQDSHYASTNLIWHPLDLVKVGFEVMYGQVEDKGGDTGENVRLQSSVQWKF
jgi:hypothetical protein